VPNSIRVESLDQEGRGVAHLEGKVIFIQGALPGEVVSYVTHEKKPNYEVAHVGRIIKAASLRVAPRCAHYTICGG